MCDRSVGSAYPCLGTRSRPGFCRGRFVLGRQCDVPIRLINLNNGVIFDIFSTFNEYYEYSLVVCVQFIKYSLAFLRERMGLQPSLAEYGFLTKLHLFAFDSLCFSKSLNYSDAYDVNYGSVFGPHKYFTFFNLHT